MFINILRFESKASADTVLSGLNDLPEDITREALTVEGDASYWEAIKSESRVRAFQNLDQLLVIYNANNDSRLIDRHFDGKVKITTKDYDFITISEVYHPPVDDEASE